MKFQWFDEVRKAGIGIFIDNVGSLMFADNLVHVGLITNAENSE